MKLRAAEVYRVVRTSIAFLFLPLLFCRGLAAQTPTGSVVGRVTDQNGAAIEGVRLELKNLETNDARVVSSSVDGDFAAIQLPLGDYRMLAEKSGFRTVEWPKLGLQAERTIRLDLSMIPGEAAAKVVMSDEEVDLDTENADTGETAGEEEIEETPLEGRDFQDLGFQTAGVLKKAAGGAGGNFTINGARADNTDFLLDGFNNRNVKGGGQQIRVPIDAMQEFKMQVSSYSAEYGRFGGGVMNVVLRRGTNQLHGTVFEFIRNDLADARNFFAEDKTMLRRNQFGATANGPVYLPRIYDGRNRTFFLISWESYRQRMGPSRLSRVPTGRERGGDFSQTVDADGAPIPLKDPLSTGSCARLGQAGCFPGNVLPRSRWNPISERLLPYYPLENNPGSVNNYRAVKRDADNWDSFVFKIDQRFTPSDAVAVRFGRRLAATTGPFAGSPLPGFGETVSNPQLTAGINYSRIFNARWINDLRLGVVRTTNHQTSFNGDTDFVDLFGLQGVSNSREFWGFPRFTVRDYGALGDPAANPTMFIVNTWQAQDSVSWVRSKHTVRFGGEYLKSQYTQDANNNLRGTFNFLGRWTGSSFADFLLGALNNSTRQLGSYRNYISSNSYSLFAQDDWRAGRNLTINLGLRYEIYYPPEDKYGRWTNYVPEIGKQVIGSRQTLANYDELLRSANLADRVTTAQEEGYPGALVYPNTHGVAPRIGLAWAPTGRRTVVRSGYGIFYSSLNLNSIRGDLGAAFPFLVKQTFNRNANQFSRLTLSDPFPDAIKATTDVTTAFGYELRPRASYLQSWNLAIEREINSETIFEAVYTGSKGTHLGRKYDINQPLRRAGLGPPFPRPYPGFNTINYYSFGSNSNYNSMMLLLRRRFTGGGMLRVNYTLAKSIDESSQLSGAGDGGYGGAQDARNLWLERGRSDWDVRHAFTANANYMLPLFSRSRLLAGWRISGTARIYSGPPFTPQTSNVQLDQGEANRPDRVAFGNLATPTPERWFDLTAFPVVPTGAFRFGNSGRNILNGPGQVQINAGLSKNFALKESGTFQFRVEAFNIINHANFDLPNVNVNAANGGTITQADEGRRFQAALKFTF